MITWFEVSENSPEFIEEMGMFEEHEVFTGLSFWDVEPYEDMDHDDELMRLKKKITVSLEPPIQAASIVRLCAADGRFLQLLDKYAVPFLDSPVSRFTRTDGSVVFVFVDSWELLRDAVEYLFARWIQAVFIAMGTAPTSEQTEAWFVAQDYDWFAGCWFFWKHSFSFNQDIIEILTKFMDAAGELREDA